MSEKKILLMGNPNVGKSAIFSRLTGAKIIISNYPGTTVEYTQGRIAVDGEGSIVIDVPGTYSLKPTSRAEEVAVELLKEGDVIINVVNATNLERNLFLTLQLLEWGLPMVVALNMWDETKHQGIYIDVEKLEKRLGVPVVTTCGLSGEGIKKLIERLHDAKVLQRKKLSDTEKWEMIGDIVKEAQTLKHHHHTIFQRIEEWTIRPASGLVIAGIILYSVFWLIRFVAEHLIDYVFGPMFEKLWLPILLKISALLSGTGFLHHLLIGELVDGRIDFGISFGVLSTGLYLYIVMVLPYLFSFYLALGILEDFGYLPRLAVLADNFLHHIGLHGYAIIPFMLGLGCNVPGALALRLLEGRREKFIAATLLAITVPCMAQIAMIIGLLGKRGGQYLGIVFGVLFLLFIIKGIILNKLLKGTSPEILVEIPPYRIPQLAAIFKKLGLRLYWFLKEAFPYVLLGIVLVNILYALKIIDFFSKIFMPVVTNVWGLPKEAVSALIIGFLRKDVAVGMLGPLGLTTKQLIIACTILAVYFPCVATFTVLTRELGIKDMLKATLIMLTVAFLVGAILNIIL